MSENKFNSLVPHIEATALLGDLESLFSSGEIQVYILIDGKTSVEGLASLTNNKVEEVYTFLCSLEDKSLIQWSYLEKKSEQSSVGSSFHPSHRMKSRPKKTNVESTRDSNARRIEELKQRRNPSSKSNPKAEPRKQRQQRTSQRQQRASQRQQRTSQGQQRTGQRQQEIEEVSRQQAAHLEHVSLNHPKVSLSSSDSSTASSTLRTVSSRPKRQIIGKIGHDPSSFRSSTPSTSGSPKQFGVENDAFSRSRSSERLKRLREKVDVDFTNQEDLSAFLPPKPSIDSFFQADFDDDEILSSKSRSEDSRVASQILNEKPLHSEESLFESENLSYHSLAEQPSCAVSVSDKVMRVSDPFGVFSVEPTLMNLKVEVSSTFPGQNLTSGEFCLEEALSSSQITDLLPSKQSNETFPELPVVTFHGQVDKTAPSIEGIPEHAYDFVEELELLESSKKEINSSDFESLGQPSFSEGIASVESVRAFSFSKKIAEAKRELKELEASFDSEEHIPRADVLTYSEAAFKEQMKEFLLDFSEDESHDRFVKTYSTTVKTSKK